MKRRDLLLKSSCGFGYLSLVHSLMGKTTHYKQRAKRVILMYMNGGPSHVDTFDHKPLLETKNDTEDPNSRGRKLMRDQWGFEPCGESGIMISNLFSETRKHADKMCIINSMKSSSGNHEQARTLLHTGNFQFVRPSMGAWINYGLGNLNETLPGFVSINSTITPEHYGSSFLPANFQGTDINIFRSKDQIPNIRNKTIKTDQQIKNLDLLKKLNQINSEENKNDNDNIESVIKSYELAFKMQSSVPNVINIENEDKKILELYGIDQKETEKFGKQCLIARKFAEEGVRFIEIGCGGWDMHNNIKDSLGKVCKSIDKPIYGLLTDLENRGMLDDTLIIWAGEFGRTPGIQKDATGRDHNHKGYSIWMAGGGIKGGMRYGATDDFGHEAVEDVVDIHDLHATILYLMGLDHEQLTFQYSGRPFRLTDVKGNIKHKIIV